MTLDETIEKCTELSRRHADTEAGREFGQMAGWLGEYRAMLAKGAARGRRRLRERPGAGETLHGGRV